MALEANSRLVRRDTQTRTSLGLQIAGRALSKRMEIQPDDQRVDDTERLHGQTV